MNLDRSAKKSLQRLSWVREISADGRSRELRIQKNIAGAEMARIIGVTPTTLSRWENGHRSPRGAAAERYALVLEALIESRDPVRLAIDPSSLGPPGEDHVASGRRNASAVQRTGSALPAGAR